jgi:hypothetical protein
MSSYSVSDPSHQFDDKKHYNKVKFQQGKPILDVDLNDLSEALISQSRSSLIEKMGFGPPQLDYTEWAITSVDAVPNSPRNTDNLSFTLGRLDTHKGVIDTNTYKNNALDSKIIFDYFKVADANISEAQDHSYANYLLKGKVTASSANTTFEDNTKDFNTNLKLTGFDNSLTVTPSYNTINSIVDTSTAYATSAFQARFVEGACRVIFTSGANTGVERTILTASGDDLTFAALPSPLAVGNTYVIVPANTLTAYRAGYDAKQDRATSEPLGLANHSKLLVYVQVFEEDISSEEDDDIQSSLLGYETTHRNQLRWCVRIAEYYESIDGDSNFTSLKLQHIFEQLSSSEQVEYKALVDSLDKNASLNDGYLQTQLWKNNDSSGTVFSDANIGTQVSPFYNVGITPLHFFSAQEAQIQNLLWAFLKSCMLSTLDTQSGFNDVQILSLFHSESKTTDASSPTEFLSSTFYPGAFTDLTSTPKEHAFLSNTYNFNKTVAGYSDKMTPGSFLSPPKLFQTHAELSLDNMQSRTLFGFKGGFLLSNTTNNPLVFSSLKDHISFIDQALLGSLGIGYSLGQDAEGNRVDSYYTYTSAGSTNIETQSGYGDGAVKMIDILNSTTPSYELRSKGTRSSHSVSINDEDLGWSFYKKEGSNLQSSTGTDLSIRQWNEGVGQAKAVRDAINFRKLAIKTVAHKSMDMFTISPRPLGQDLSVNYNASYSDILGTDSSVSVSQIQYSSLNVPYLLPFTDANDNEVYNTYRDTYSALGREVGGNIPAFQANMFMPNNTTYGLFTSVGNKSNYNARDLLERYQPQNSGVASYVQRNTNITPNLDTNQNALGNYYGPWGRFSFSEAAWTRSTQGGTLNVPMDTWANRCTAMRLRYHIGDFYPNGTDARGIPKNLLVDSLNLFVRIEPLSLTHWMTMPKHQHSILENSLVLADGIEALLAVSHGLGDTQKLINSSGQPLLQTDSPYTQDAFYNGVGVRTTRDMPSDNVDPMDLPFGHEKQPFVHWYHPTQNEMRYKDAANANDTLNFPKKYTYYPKWGRRSLIAPAIVPFLDYYTQTGSNLGINTEKDFIHADSISTDSDFGSVDTTVISSNINENYPIPKSTIVYPVHATDIGNGDQAQDTSFTIQNIASANIVINQNALTFPYVPNSRAGLAQDKNEPTPVFLPASRFYYKQAPDTVTGGQSDNSDLYKPQVGYNKIIESYSDYSDWGLDSKEDTNFPYSEQDVFWLAERGLNSPEVTDLPNELQRDFKEWTVPVMRSAIRTTTVAGIVDLVRTSFANALDSSTLPSEIGYTTSGENKGVVVPAIGPDIPTDTLYVGDTGTALSQVYERTGFMSPLTLGVGAVLKDGGLVHNNHTNVDVYRDSFDVYIDKTDSTDQLRKTFNALKNMGLQIKLLTNCSFRVLHSRPNGSVGGGGTISQSTAPKSITEVFIGHNRNKAEDASITPVQLPDLTSIHSKPFLHLASMNKGISTTNPNLNSLGHLKPMVSDTIGGAMSINTSSNSLPTDSDFDSPFTSNRVPNLTYLANQRNAVGDTYAADPFDYTYAQVLNPSANPMNANENLEANSGIEIDLIKELDLMHATPSDYNIDNGSGVTLQQMIPTSAEMTLPGDHEIIFVLYTGHYGAKMYDTNDEIDTTHIAPVAGCHLTATLEVNRPSERINSTSTDEHHYGQTVDSNPIKTHSILSSK